MDGNGREVGSLGSAHFFSLGGRESPALLLCVHTDILLIIRNSYKEKIIMGLSDSQNYINNQQLVHKLLGFVDFESTKTILEIGPGRGIITDILIKQKKNIIAVEADPKLFSELQKNMRM